MKHILIIFLVTTTGAAIYGQTQVAIDGDKINLRDSLDGNIVMLSHIERGAQNADAIWITYDRRPAVDPWIQEAGRNDTRYSDETFVRYWNERGIRILGAITTYDDCQCAKHRTMGSPDMYLIHFKIFPANWIRLKEIYPDIETYVKKVKLK